MNMGSHKKDKKPKSEKVYTLRVSDIERLKRDAVDQAVEKAWKMMFGFPVLALRDEFGFGKTRLNRFVESVLNKYDSYDKGYISIADIDQTLLDEVGISLEHEVKTHRLF